MSMFGIRKTDQFIVSLSQSKCTDQILLNVLFLLANHLKGSLFWLSFIIYKLVPNNRGSHDFTSENYYCWNVFFYNSKPMTVQIPYSKDTFFYFLFQIQQNSPQLPAKAVLVDLVGALTVLNREIAV